MNLTDTVCINCGNPVATPFCSACGQASPPKKLSLLTLYTDFQSRIYGFDGMFPRTLRDLTTRPGHVAETYINGNRVKYVAPVGYFFLALTMFILFMEILGIDLLALSKNNNLFAPAPSENQEIFQKYFTDMMSRYLRIFSFLLIPITALAAWLFFKKQRYNILEHSILVFYTYGHLIWFSILNLFLFKLYDLNLNFFQLLLQSLLYAFGCVGLYKYQSRTKVFLKGMAISVISLLCFTILIASIGLLYILSNPELMEMMKKSGQK